MQGSRIHVLWLAGLAAAALFGATATAPAANTWDADGGANDNWDYSSGAGVYDNWDDNLLPAATADVRIQTVNSSGNSISLNGNRTVNSLTLNQTVSQDFSIDNNTLTVTSGRITRNTGSLGRHDIQSTILLGTHGEFVNDGTSGTSHRLGVYVVDDGPSAFNMTYRGSGVSVFDASTYGGQSLIGDGTAVTLGNTASTQGKALNSTAWTVNGGSLTLGINTGSAVQDDGTATFGRLANAAPVTLNGSSLVLVPIGNTTGDNATERFGTLTFGTGRSTLRATRGGTTTGEATLLPSAFARDGSAAGTRGTVFVDQSGTTQLLATREFVKGTSYAGLVTVGGGGSRATDDSIVPFMVVDNVFGTSGRPDSFLRVDSGNGLTALVAADYFTDINTVNADGNDNVRIAQAGTLTITMTANQAINALVLDNTGGNGTDLTLAGSAGTTLTVKSGAVLGGSTGNANANTAISVPTLAFGSAEAVFTGTTSGGSGFTISSAITGSQGLTTGGRVTFSGNNSGLTGPITVNNSTATFANLNPANAANDVRVRRGAIFLVNSQLSGDDSLTVGSLSGAGQAAIGNNGSLSISSTAVTSGGQQGISLLAGGSLSPGDVPQFQGATLATGTLEMQKTHATQGLAVYLTAGTLNIDLASKDYFDALSLTTSGSGVPSLTLGGTDLVVNLGFAPAAGALFKIVDVGGTTASTGAFADGTTVSSTYGGRTYKFDILYNSAIGGGTGNDIVLRARAPAGGTVVYIR